MGSFFGELFCKKLANLRVSAMLTGGTHLPYKSKFETSLQEEQKCLIIQ
jgi:hypothetical protein